MKDRILKIIREEQLTPARFADIIGVQRSSISHYLSGRNNPSLDFAQKILLKFKNINSEWLILGKGEMYKHQGLSQPLFENSTSTPSDVQSIITPEDLKNHSNPELNSEILEPQKVISDINKPKVVDNQVSIERIVIFYNNRTFKEYFPS